jgi:DNA-binding HxlR family transcriptional regulator
MKTYGQYCPIARAAEIFAERWTPVILRNLMMGCDTFGELQAGAPGIPRSLLSKRLRLLERDGLVAREPAVRGHTYRLTRSGQELGDICVQLGIWGKRWLETRPEHRDPYLVMWFWSKMLDRTQLPKRRITVRFDLTDGSKPDRFWVLLSPEETEVCLRSPGFDDDLVITATTEWLVRWHSGEVTLAAARRAGGITFAGAPSLVRGFARWSVLSPFADVPRAV